MRQTGAFLLPFQYSAEAHALCKLVKAKMILSLPSTLFVVKLGVNRDAVGSATPFLFACLPACLAGWLPLPEPQYFTAIVSAIDSAVNPAPHPWKRFRILIPLTPPVHLNLNAFCKQDFMHDLLPPSPRSSPPYLSPSLTSWLTIPPKNLCGDGFSSCGLRECAVHNSSHGAGRQAGSSPSLSGLFTRFPSIRLICVLTLFGALGS